MRGAAASECNGQAHHDPVLWGQVLQTIPSLLRANARRAEMKRVGKLQTLVRAEGLRVPSEWRWTRTLRRLRHDAGRRSPHDGARGLYQPQCQLLGHLVPVCTMACTRREHPKRGDDHRRHRTRRGGHASQTGSRIDIPFAAISRPVKSTPRHTRSVDIEEWGAAGFGIKRWEAQLKSAIGIDIPEGRRSAACSDALGYRELGRGRDGDRP